MSTATAPTPLFDRIHDALTTNPYVPSQQVRVEAADGRVVLKGSVRSFFQKQMAQEAIRRVDGVAADRQPAGSELGVRGCKSLAAISRRRLRLRLTLTANG